MSSISRPSDLDPKRWAEARAVFEQVAEAGTADRAPLIERLCEGDPELRREVRSLLDAYLGAGEFLNRPAATLVAPEEPDPLSGALVGPYRLIAELGSGGMGRVFLAERADEVFQKQVALKVLRRGRGETSVRRFFLERQILATLEHPNVARILDGGTLPDGRPYLVMEHVDGARLDRYCESHRLSVADRIRLFLKVSSAVEAAHARLVVHGDLKPANIVVTSEREPKVVDFGVAAWLDAPAPASGATPGYASPEQLRNEPLTVASDVYALGRVLYGILAGDRREGRVLPGELRHVVRKAVREDPAERYSSVRELTRDLERWLRHEPVSAVPQSVLYLARKRAARNKAVSVLLLVVTMLGAAVTLAEIRSRHEAARRERLERHFHAAGMELLEIDRRDALVPIHDSSETRDAIARRMAELRRTMEAEGDAAAGPGNYALGCGALARDDYDAARAHFEAALQAGFDPPEITFLLGKTLFMLYRERLDEAERLAGPGEREAWLAELDRRYKERALQLIASAGPAAAEEKEYLEALLAYCEERYTEAIRLARRAFERHPWLYEAKQLEAEAGIALAAEATRAGDFERRHRLLEQAESPYREALAVGRSDPSLWSGECSRRAQIFDDPTLGALPQSEIENRFRWALEPCGMALQIEPGRADVHLSRAQTHWRRAEGMFRRYQDPTEALAAAITSARAVLAAHPMETRAHRLVGDASYVSAVWQGLLGGDPTPGLDQGERAFRRAADLNPNSAAARAGMGKLLFQRAEYLKGRRNAPLAVIDEAIAWYAAAVELEPNLSIYRAGLGTAYSAKATYELARGRPAGESMAGALAAFDRVLELTPQDPTSRFNRANLLQIDAAYRIARGEVLAGRLQAAYEDVAELRRAYPDAIGTRGLLAENRYLEALRLVEGGQDPNDAAEEGLRALEVEQGRAPELAVLWRLEAQFHLLSARRTVQLGRSPERALDRALAALRTAESRRQRDRETPAVLAEAHWRRALWLEKTGGHPAPDIAAGLEATAEAGPAASGGLLTARAALLALRATVENDAELRREAIATLTRANEVKDPVPRDMEDYVERLTDHDENDGTVASRALPGWRGDSRHADPRDDHAPAPRLVRR